MELDRGPPKAAHINKCFWYMGCSTATQAQVLDNFPTIQARLDEMDLTIYARSQREAQKGQMAIISMITAILTKTSRYRMIELPSNGL